MALVSFRGVIFRKLTGAPELWARAMGPDWPKVCRGQTVSFVRGTAEPRFSW